MLRRLFAALAAWTLCAAAAAQQLTADHFTQQPTIWGAALSPDGRYVALIQEVPQGDALVIMDWRARQSQAIQLARHDRSLFIDWVEWKDDNRLLFVLRQRYNWIETDVTGTRRSQGDVEQYDVTRVFAVNRDGSGLTQMFEGEMRRLAADFAPIELIDSLPNEPEHVLLGTYGQRGYTVYRANLANGRVNAIDDAGWDTMQMYVDGAGNPVMRVDLLSGNSGFRIYRRPPRGGRWEVAHEVRRSTVAQNRDFLPLGAGPGAGQVYVAARPQGEEFQSIYLYDTTTGNLGEPVFRQERADAWAAWLDPNDNSLIVGCWEAQRWECRAADRTMQRHFDALHAYFEGAADLSLVGVSRDEGIWMLRAEGPTMPGAYFIYSLSEAQISPVASEHPQLPSSALAPTQIVNYAGRDGAPLWGYLTGRSGAGARPLVVMPHGGPESRDSYEYDFFAQFLASRGYLVFQPNFRGSEGSGRSFAAAGYRQWGRRMQDDITDGVRHLVDQGVADANRICIVGASYGGYATLAGLSLTPDLYRCGISIAGVSDLIAFLDSERREEGRRSTTYAYWTRIIGDANADRESLLAASPAQHANAITAPLLLMHGSEDEIVLLNQSEIMRDAMQRAGKPVEYVTLAGEGHFWGEWRRASRKRLLEETERFLAEHIGAP